MSWTDAFSRTARALRVSVTDRCNLRCLYCMSANPAWLPKKDILSYEELARLVKVAVSCGVVKVRITGGEPLARRELHRFVSLLRLFSGLEELTLTTNGIYLPAQARALAEAGLHRITVSLDTLDPWRFEAIARRPGHAQVLRGMDAAEEAGFRPLKVNMVVMKGYNDDEICAMADWGRRRGRQVRFIEFMPLEGDHIWSRDQVVPAGEIVRRIAERFPLRARGEQPGETAAMYDYADGKGSLGIIASVTRAFCSTCDRVRITADGGFRTCLFAAAGLDLRAPLRRGAKDEELARLMGGAVGEKWAGHLINLPGFVRPDRAMNAIGG